MAKAAVKEVAVVEQAGVPAELMAEFEAHAGEGVSTSMEDQLLPYIGIVQPGSPQIKRGHEKYIEGIKIGDILISSLGRWWDGEKGIEFVPAHFNKDCVEWVPRDQGGGIAGRFPERPKDARRIVDPENAQRQKWGSPRGNDYVDTNYHYGIIVNGAEALGGEPLGAMQGCVTLSSSGLQFSRSWETLQNNIKLPNGAIAPARARRWRLTTANKSKGGFDWMVFRCEDLGWNADKAIYDAAGQMFEAIKAGTLKAEAGEGPAADPETADDSVPF
jgi:hypothetical protein